MQAERLRPLAGDQADTAGSRVEEYEVATLQAFLRQRLAQQVLGGQALQHHRGAGLERDRVRQFDDAFGGHHAQRAVTARRVAGVSSAVAHLQMGHALAHGLDDTRRLHPERQRHRQRVHARTLVHIDEIQAAGMVADADLAWPRLADRKVDEVHGFGAAVLIDANGGAGLGHESLTVGGEGRYGASIATSLLAARGLRNGPNHAPAKMADELTAPYTTNPAACAANTPARPKPITSMLGSPGRSSVGTIGLRAKGGCGGPSPQGKGLILHSSYLWAGLNSTMVRHAIRLSCQTGVDERLGRLTHGA